MPKKKISSLIEFYQERLEQYNTHTPWIGEVYLTYSDIVRLYTSCINNLNQCEDFLYFLGDSIEKQFCDCEELKPIITTAWKEGVQLHKRVKVHIDKETSENLIKNYVNKIQKIDPDYVAPEHIVPDIIAPVRKEFKTAKAGCYIATCVYGSYDCPEVWTLRRYRDSKLGASHGGRAFIRFYYAISPTLVKWFGNTKWFKKMWRGMLDKKVQKLQAQGYESTPYNDLEWRK